MRSLSPSPADTTADDADHVWWLPARYAVPAIVSAAVFVALALLVALGWDALFRVDSQVARDLHSWMEARPTVVDVTRFLTDWVWDPNAFRILAAGLAAGLWAARRRRTSVWVVTVMVIGGAAGGLCKLAVARDRPTFADPIATAHGWSFPSGHALNGVLGCGVLLIGLWPLLPRRVRPVAVVVAVVSVLGVGFTRIALGVHYLSDVVAGWALGVVVLAVFWVLVTALWDPLESAGAVPEDPEVEAEITSDADTGIDVGRPDGREPG
ncbi:phosphatase PAP2 family protein [Streptodolium elevatio]|uniref:Phosphatase PAP2 family protein n=1 Tax=Streptodolium elevatio TaxID=3157996 RepID=A0ABV3D8J6_9ACTN